MGTGSSTKCNDDDVRDRLNSGDFQKISPPSSPNIEEPKNDEMSYSGILVEKPGSEAPGPTSPTVASTTLNASFAADLTTPPMSNRSKNRTKTAGSTKEQPRRIVKATHPPSSKGVVEMDVNRSEKVDSPATGHSPALASPIGVNAVTEMLEESIEKNDSKNKRMERVSNKQKSDREKLLQEKRRRQQPSSSSKPKVQANPFSRFLSAFSVDANPKHKRKESIDAGDAGDPNKRLKFGFDDGASKTDGAVPGDPESDSTDSSDTNDGEGSFPTSLMVAVSVAALAVLVFAFVRGSKKK